MAMPQHSVYEPPSPYHHGTPFPLYHHHSPLHLTSTTTPTQSVVPEPSHTSLCAPNTPPSSTSPPSSASSVSGSNNSNSSVPVGVSNNPSTPTSSNAGSISAGVNALLDMTPPSPTTDHHLSSAPSTPYTPNQHYPSRSSTSDPSEMLHLDTTTPNYSPYSPHHFTMPSPAYSNPIPAHYHSSHPSHHRFYGAYPGAYSVATHQMSSPNNTIQQTAGSPYTNGADYGQYHTPAHNPNHHHPYAYPNHHLSQHSPGSLADYGKQVGTSFLFPLITQNPVSHWDPCQNIIRHSFSFFLFTDYGIQ